MRLGFLGHLLNFVAPGYVGGDLFKAFFIAHEQADRRAEAIATIVVDRAFGLYGLLVVASIAMFLTTASRISPEVAAIVTTTYILCGVATLCLMVLMLPQASKSGWFLRAAHLPRIGPIIRQLHNAFRKYQDSKPQLAAVGAMSLLIHVLVAFAIFLAAGGLYQQIPTLGEHLVISPLASVAGALPLSPGGLGTYELALEVLYDLMSPGTKGQGFIIALFYRLATILVASVGLVFFWLHHREISRVLKEAETHSREKVGV